MALLNRTATIAINASLSGAVAAGGGTLALVITPASWTAADLTFQASYDGETYANVYEASSDTEYTVQAGASRAIAIPEAVLRGARYVKVRSGTSGSAVNQEAARALTLVFVR